MLIVLLRCYAALNAVCAQAAWPVDQSTGMVQPAPIPASSSSSSSSSSDGTINSSQDLLKMTQYITFLERKVVTQQQ
jgi:hypothetical protein